MLDFGVSRFFDVEEKNRGMVVGTPEFMAPEQITDPEHVDKRADIYALGVILYEMLTARRPFSVDDDPQLLMHHIVSKAPPPLLRNEVPHGLSALIMDKLLAKAPGDRYQSMGDVQAALEQFITRGDGTPVPRRRSQPIAIVKPEFEEAPETSARLPSKASATPKPVAVRDTPWPVATLDTPIAMGQVSLPKPPPHKRAYVLYGVAGAGILMGTIGLIVGLRGGSEPAPAPAPIAQVQQPAPAPAAAAVPAAPEKIEVSLDADVPNARVVFRRRVHEAPAKMEINATDVVELVEVSATGYKTVRYWLTFDRATYLKAHMVRGTGSVEATEEETLAALGEVIMVTGEAPKVAAAEPAPAPAAPAPAPAAAMPAATHVASAQPTPMPAVAKTVEKPAPVQAETKVAMAPRKIGRAAADAEPAPEAKEAPKVETSPVAPVAKEEPKEEPKHEPVKTEPTKVADAPKEEPKPAVDEPVRPVIDRATVSSVISTHRPEVLKCFAEGKKKNPAMKGTLSLQLQVNPAGAVHRVQVQSTLNNPLVAACVVKAANAWKFPARTGGEIATVAYPFTIN